MSKLEGFYKYYGITDKPGPEKIQGKAKTPESILDKVIRNVEQGNKKTDFVVGNISDLSRCAVLFDSYSEISEFILKLKQSIPQIDGYISRHHNGYRGIHLNFTLDGVKTEIQLTTHKAWEYAQATEKIYAKWRSVDFAKMQEELRELQNQADKTQDPDLKKSLEQQIVQISKQILNLQREMDNDNNKTNEVYRELNSDGEFAKYESKIESTLLMFKLMKGQEQSVKVPKEFNEKFIVNNDGTVDRDDAKNKIAECCKYTSNVQDKLISSVSTALQVNTLNSEENSAFASDREYLESVLKHYDYVLDKHVDHKLYQNNMVDFSKQKSALAIEVTKFVKEKNLFNVEPKEAISVFLTKIKAENSEDLAKYSIVNLVQDLEKKNQHEV